jgi:hypothetical protein
MVWHVQYRNGTGDSVTRHPTPERAIEAACRLIDAGCDVYGIGTGPLADSIGREQIARIYDIWARESCDRPSQEIRPDPG